MLERYRLACIEQPVAGGDVDGLIRVKQECGISVMADESLVTRDQAINLAARKACDLFNVRISKCGGIVRSLDIAAIARSHGIRVQVGALVGETAAQFCLRQAGTWRPFLPDIAYAEGSFGTKLLSEDIARRISRSGSLERRPY